MTPLYYRIVKDLTLPVKHRKVFDPRRFAHMLSDAHCFEASEVMDAVQLLFNSRGEGRDSKWMDENKDLLFLPAPKTWVEWSEKQVRMSVGMLIEKDDNANCYRIALALQLADMPPFLFEAGRYNLETNRIQNFSIYYADDFPDWINCNEQIPHLVGHTISILPCIMAIINTPRIIGRRQHSPHRGLERRLLAQQKVIGKFPLRAWTEIKLEVGPPTDESGEPATEARLTGQRALHFCRAHLRIYQGRIIHVRAHWRGDASLGIKQSRYKLTPGKPGSDQAA